MRRHKVILAIALACGCFSENTGATDVADGSDSRAESAVDSGDTSTASSTTTTSSASQSDPTTGSAEVSSATSSDTSTADTSTTAESTSPEPRAVWRFDGDLVEDIAGADATAVGSVDFVASPSSMAATPAASSYIDASAAGLLVLANLDAFTVFMRLRMDDHVGSQVLWSLGPAYDMSPERNAMALSNLDGLLRLFTETGAAENHTVDLSSTPAIGQWVEMVVVVDADDVRVFLDSQLAGASPFLPVETSTTELYIGGLLNTSEPTATLPLHGAIDEVRIWDIALDEAQVLAIPE